MSVVHGYGTNDHGEGWRGVGILVKGGAAAAATTTATATAQPDQSGRGSSIGSYGIIATRREENSSGERHERAGGGGGGDFTWCMACLLHGGLVCGQLSHALALCPSYHQKTRLPNLRKIQ
uniref:Uncharacterized protein n=1 Tax=Oryza barthii TaxID=65489 RepID=A0A0D3FFK4_9ORYZ